jgi:hypothetical protein
MEYVVSTFKIVQHLGRSVEVKSYIRIVGKLDRSYR